MASKLKFKYFEGPEKDMGDLCQEPCECTLCGRKDICFELDFADCPELDEKEKEGKFGCVKCLREGRFEFHHDTDIGFLDERGLTKVYKHNADPPPDFPTEALTELRRTPDVIRWQYEPWLSHCKDFMAYQGTWVPGDFYKNGPGGDGRALFMEMTDDLDLNHLWDDSLSEGETQLKEWHAAYYVYKCLHCGKLRGNWDCD